MSLGSKLPVLRNLSALTSSSESEADEVTPPCLAPPSDAAIPRPDAVILPPSCREDAQDSAPASSDGNASAAIASESGKTPAWGRTPSIGAIDAGPVVIGGSSSWPALSESAKISTKTSSNGSASALGCPANSPPMLRKFAKGGGGGRSSDGVGTSGSFSSDSVPSSSSSIASSVEVSQNIAEKQPGKGNYRSWDHRFRESRGWIDQGDRQRKHDGNIRRGSYGNRRDDCAGHEWSSTRRLSGRDSHIPRGQPRPPVMPPLMPAMGPFIVPPMPVQPFPGPMTFPDFPSQVYYFPTHLHPECFIGFPFVPHPLPSAVQPSTSFAWSDQQRTLLLKQIEYYFSSENLCKDVFLRTNMDEHGWVPIYLIAGFNRVKKLTDNIQFILDAVRSSDFMEVEGNKVRKRYGWSDWILNSHKNRYADKSDPQSQATTNQESLFSQFESIGLAEEMSG